MRDEMYSYIECVKIPDETDDVDENAKKYPKYPNSKLKLQMIYTYHNKHTGERFDEINERVIGKAIRETLEDKNKSLDNLSIVLYQKNEETGKTLTGDFHLDISFDALAFGDQPESGICFFIGLIPTSEDLIYQYIEVCPDHDFGNGFFWGKIFNLEYELGEILSKLTEKIKDYVLENIPVNNNFYQAGDKRSGAKGQAFNIQQII